MSQTASTTAPGTASSTRKKTQSGTRTSSPARKSSPSRPAARSTSAKKSSARTATVTLPFVTAEFRAPNVHVPHPSWESVPVVNRVPRPHVPEAAGRQVADAGRAVGGVVGSLLPERKETALFVGLVAATVVGALEWPVAVAVAASTEVAKRAASSTRGAPRRSPSTPDAS